jgi:hypothetical protein
MIRIVVLSLIFVILSCEKKPNTTVDSNILFLRDLALAEIYAEDILTIVDEAYTLGKLESKSVFNPTNPDAIITKDAKSMTINFGSVGIEGKDLRTRKGKIKVSFPLGYNSTNHFTEISFDSFIVNNTFLMGSRNFKYRGINTSGQKQWIVNSNIQFFQLNDGSSYSWVTERYRNQKLGASTPVLSDDAFEAIGVNDLFTYKNTKYRFNIKTPLMQKNGCSFFQEGLIQLVYNTSATFSIDFGYKENPVCDQFAKLDYIQNKYILNLIL